MIGVKKYVKLMVIFTIMCIILNFTACTSKDNAVINDSAIYITEDSTERILNVKTVKPQDLNAESFDNEVILIDGNLINNFKQEIQKRYDSGFKTVVITSNLNKNDIKTFLGLEVKVQNDILLHERTPKGRQIAIVIQKCKGIDIVADIRVGGESDIQAAIENAIVYDYSRLVGTEEFSGYWE